MTRLILLGLAELDQRDVVVELVLDPADGVELVVERVALAHDVLGARGVVPEVGVFGVGVQLGRGAPWTVSQSKMPPQQSDRLLDVFDERLGFRRAWNSCDCRIGQADVATGRRHATGFARQRANGARISTARCRGRAARSASGVGAPVIAGIAAALVASQPITE